MASGGGAYTLNTIDRPAVYAENQGGRDGGGKGPLIRNDKSATLSTLQDQTLFVPNVSGTLNPGAHPGSYNGQDAYNDLLVSTPPRNSQRDLTGAWDRKPGTSDMNVNLPEHSAQENSLTASYVDSRNGNESAEVNGTLQAKGNGGYSYNCGIVIRTTESSS